jgi:hypothetical protein
LETYLSILNSNRAALESDAACRSGDEFGGGPLGVSSLDLGSSR